MADKYPVSRIKGPRFPNRVTSFPELPRLVIFQWVTPEVPPFRESGDLISRIGQTLGFVMPGGQVPPFPELGKWCG
jgi:hypothetical protein